jgi:outer membrane protein OmpA-like peptidoglycan-associated protein
VTDGLDAFRGVWGWTGELQFNVGKVTGASPHLLVGMGQTRFSDDYRAETGIAVEDQNALVVGAGLGIPVDDRTRVTVALRDHVTTSGTLRQASSTSDLRHSLSLTGGISVLLFGQRTTPRRAVADRAAAADSADYRSGRLLAIPVPREGEIYVRYGPGGRTLPVGGGVDSTAVGAAVQEELIRMVGEGGAALTDSARAVLQARVLERLRAVTAPVVPDSAVAADPGAAGVVEAAGAVAGAPVAALRPGAEPGVEELRRQVDELTRLLRQSMVLQGATSVIGGGGTTVNVMTGAPGTPAGEQAAEPFLRALDGRLGRSAMGDGSGGVALHLDAHLGRLRDDDNLVPFASLELARQGIRADADGRAVEGSVSTLGLGFGVTAVLPHLGPVWPTVDVLVAAARAGTSADRPADEDLIHGRFGGLSLGPGFQLGAAYRPDPASRTFVTAAIRKIWAGSTSRWSVQAGLRLVFPPRSGSPTGPFSMPRPQGEADTARMADSLRTLPPPAPADTAGVPGPIIHPPPEDTLVASLAARVAALEARLGEESEARSRAEAEVRALRVRADSAAAGGAGTPEPGALVRELRTLADRLGPLMSVSDTGGGVRIVLGGTLFPVGATAVAPGSAAEVRSLGAILAAHPGASIAVEGHTDDTGTEEANLTISRLRAEAVRRLLVEGGMNSAAVTAEGRGEAAPIADNATRDGRMRNRRVEVWVRPSPAGS